MAQHGTTAGTHAAGDEPLAPIYPDSTRRPFGVTNPIFLHR